MSAYAFFPVHAKSLGITEEELGIVYGITPFIEVMVPPLAGALADKIGNFKVSLEFLKDFSLFF